MFCKICTVHAQKVLFWASGRNSNTAVGFGDPYFTYGIRILWRSMDIHNVILLFDHLTMNTKCISCDMIKFCTRFRQNYFELFSLLNVTSFQRSSLWFKRRAYCLYGWLYVTEFRSLYKYARSMYMCVHVILSRILPAIHEYAQCSFNSVNAHFTTSWKLSVIPAWSACTVKISVTPVLLAYVKFTDRTVCMTARNIMPFVRMNTEHSHARLLSSLRLA